MKENLLTFCQRFATWVTLSRLLRMIAKTGLELWTSDGTENGTYLLAALLPRGLGSNPYYLTKVGDSLFFIAKRVNSYRQLWKLHLTGIHLRGEK
jgi:ELWxxDGT repeat protein